MWRTPSGAATRQRNRMRWAPACLSALKHAGAQRIRFLCLVASPAAVYARLGGFSLCSVRSRAVPPAFPTRRSSDLLPGPEQPVPRIPQPRQDVAVLVQLAVERGGEDRHVGVVLEHAAPEGV